MANRSMTASMLTEIAKASVRLVYFVKLGFSTPEYVTTAYKDVTFDGDNYQALGHLLKVSDIRETLAVRVNSVSLTLSGVDQSFIATMLGENVTNKTLQMWLGFLDSTGALVPDPVEVFSGRIDDYKFSEDTISGTAEIQVNAANHWADWEKIAGRRTNDEDQQLYYPGDKGLEFASRIVKDLRWGQND